MMERVFSYNDEEIIVKTSKKGHRYLYYQDQNIALPSYLKYSNRPLENIQLDELLPILFEKGWVLRKVTKDIFIRKGVRGQSDYIVFNQFHKDVCISLDGFEDNDYLICSVSKIMDWIREYNKII